MKTLNSLIAILKKLLGILEDEKVALINNDGLKVAELVQIKIKITEEIEQLGIKNALDDNRVTSLIEQINEIQETNLLLTKQALRYQEVMMESIAKNLSNKSGTYQQKGSYDKEQSINFVDQSV
ncbi:MAG: hypothetical protein RBR71_05785 [Gudongella sp.]|nr:hypothetical protein [Gudongella sp.]